MISLTPAYGRDYKSKKEIMADIAAGKDFIYNDFSSPYNGKPCSPLQDLSGIVIVRYAKLTKVITARIEGGKAK